jgi:LmbE family N-acetylglucosaminyl deacetylase
MGIGVNTRMLMIGAHPDDEDTNLIAWLARGRHVRTAYLSLTRGDGGQNVIGNELGEALGVLRTEELLAARRIDGAEQYFTRAYDFGFSKDTIDTYAHWPKDTLLGDVVRVVRAFRPHVIVAVFSGTARDGHGQHQVSGLLAREAYEVAGDTLRYPAEGFGAPWTPLKFYRAARGNAQAGTLGMDVGEYSPLRGESYGEVAGRSRSQHKSQGFGALERKGPIMNYVRREATRVNEAAPATSERSLFDGIDTTWARLALRVSHQGKRMLLDSLPSWVRALRTAFDPFAPEKLVQKLDTLRALVTSICPPNEPDPCARYGRSGGRPTRVVLEPDLDASLETARIRIQSALRLAAGVTLDVSSFETWALNRPMPALADIFNRSRDTIAISGGLITGAPDGVSATRLIPPAGTLVDTLVGSMDSLSQPWWLAVRRSGAMFALPALTRPEGGTHWPGVSYAIDLGGAAMGVMTNAVEPVIFRFRDDVKGQVERPVAAVPAISITLDQPTRYVRANTDIDRELVVTLRNATLQPESARVSLQLPSGLEADSASRSAQFSRYDETRRIVFRVRGRLTPGTHQLSAIAVARGDTFRIGYTVIDYDHIRRQRVYRPASVTLAATDVRVPSGLRVAYVPGVSDNVAPALQQLGIAVTVLSASEISRTDLSRFTTVVVGPRAYEANPELATANPMLFDFARRGGTLVVQYGQYEMTRPGMMPYPVTISRPHDRVTHEEAPVTILEENAVLLRAPNRISQADFANWVQERSLYMPRTFDERYDPVIAISDPGEPLNRGGILVAPLGQGRYVYTTLAFFRQLPAGVPGAARLFVNLLSVGLPASTTP